MEREPEPKRAGQPPPERAGSEESAAGEGADRGGPATLEHHLAEFFRDSALWPVLVAASGIFVTLGATLLLLAFRDRNLFAVAALLLVVVASADIAYRDLSRRRLGLASGFVAVLWTLSAAAAVIAVRLGIF